MTSLNISLPESLREYIEREVSRGGYSTPSEYVRELVRADQKRKSEDHLEALLLKGLRSGKPTAMTKKDWTELRKRVFEGRVEKTRRQA